MSAVGYSRIALLIVHILTVQAVAATAGGRGNEGHPCLPPCCQLIHYDFGTEKRWYCHTGYPKCRMEATIERQCDFQSHSGEWFSTYYEQHQLSENCMTIPVCLYVPWHGTATPGCLEPDPSPCFLQCDPSSMLNQIQQWCQSRLLNFRDGNDCQCDGTPKVEQVLP